MRRSALLVAVWLAMGIGSWAGAQQPNAPIEPSRVNAARIRWLQYRMVSGRVVASSDYPDGMNISFGPSTVGGSLRESLQLLILKDQASIRYSLDGRGENLAITLDELGELSIRRTRDEPPLAMYFVQPKGKPLILAVRDRDQQHVVSGDSFWHLYLADPQLVARELVPSLELLRPNWQLVATAEDIQRTLVTRSTGPTVGDTRHWSALVAQLGNSTFAKREVAERELNQAGQRVLPFLKQLDFSRLDAEQAARIARLKQTLEANYEDNVDRVSSSLLGDLAAWLAIASSGDAAKRAVAKSQIEAIIGGKISFDPAADEALRSAQIARLLERWNRPLDTPALAEVEKMLESVPPPVAER